MGHRSSSMAETTTVHVRAVSASTNCRLVICRNSTSQPLIATSAGVSPPLSFCVACAKSWLFCGPALDFSGTVGGSVAALVLLLRDLISTIVYNAGSTYRASRLSRRSFLLSKPGAFMAVSLYAPLVEMPWRLD